MSLSKPWLGSWENAFGCPSSNLDHQGDALSVFLDQASGFILQEVARYQVPLDELAHDTFDGIAGVLDSLGEGILGKSLHGKSIEGHACNSHDVDYQDVVPSGMSNVLQTCTSVQLWTPAVLMLLAAPAANASVVICGLSISGKVVYGVVSMVLAIGAQRLWVRHPNEPDRTMQRRCAVMLVTSSVLNLTLGAVGAVPDTVGQYMAHPEIAAHFLEDFVALPISALNLGHLAGVDRWAVWQCAGYMALSTMASLGGAVFVSNHAEAACVVVSVGAMSAASVHLSSWVTSASELSSYNMMRCQTAGDLLKFTVFLNQMIQGLGVTGVLSETAQTHVFALLDLLQKLGCSHVMLRSARALRKSAQQMQQLAGAPQSANAGEP